MHQNANIPRELFENTYGFPGIQVHFLFGCSFFFNFFN